MEYVPAPARDMPGTAFFSELARHAGEAAPDLTLPDVDGNAIRFSDAWRTGPLVIVFHRGDWCGPCMRQLSAWQANVPALHGLHAQLIAISPDSGERLRSTIRSLGLSFAIVSDPALSAATQFGVVPPEGAGLDANTSAEPAVLDGEGRWIQPVPATFVVRSDGRILFAHVDRGADQRTAPADVLLAILADRLKE